MPISVTCERCKGEGCYEALGSQHDDKTETVKCEKCNGRGTVYQMTESEERDYWEDYW
jgi:DnaJ-class molecular chaperone